MGNEYDTSGEDAPGMVDSDTDDDVPLAEVYEDNLPLDRLIRRRQDPRSESTGALTVQTAVDRPDDLDQSADDGRDYGRPDLDENADDGPADAIGQSDDEGDGKDEWLTGSESFLRAQAMSMDHLRNHRPKNTFCTTCCCCCLVRRTQQRKVKEDRRKLTKFGQCFTLDLTSMRIKGVGGFSHALPIIDKHVYFRAGEPCKRLDTEESERHVRWYVAQDPIGSVYADGAKGVKRAIENLGISFEASEP